MGSENYDFSDPRAFQDYLQRERERDTGTEATDGLISWFASMQKFTFHWNKICSKKWGATWVLLRIILLSGGMFTGIALGTTFRERFRGRKCLGSPRHFQPIVYLSNSQQGRAPPARESLLGDGTMEQDGWSKPNSSGTRWSSIQTKNI